MATFHNLRLNRMIASISPYHIRLGNAPPSTVLNCVCSLPNVLSQSKRHVHHVRSVVKPSRINNNICEAAFPFPSISYLSLTVNNRLSLRNTCATYKTSSALHCDSERFENKPSENDGKKHRISSESEETETIKVDLDPEFKSYIEEIRKEFGQDPSDDVERNNTDNSHLLEKRKDSDNEANNSSIPITIQDKYVSYDDYNAEIILDEDEILETLEKGEESPYLKQEEVDEFSGIDLSRGISGVFDIEDIVEILEKENLRDICVISVPEEKKYADYLVIASCKSARQSIAVAAFIQKLHKRKKDENDPFLKIEGEKTTNWKAIDLGNIVVHLFMPDTRENYDIEMLWTVGEEFDDISQKTDSFYDIIQKHSFDFAEYKPLA